jgi:putative endonuclease
MKSHYIYIATNHSRTLYIGVTNDLQRRMYEHKLKLIEGFTKKYDIDKLIYFEESYSINDAIAREKQLKKWSRSKKITLIESTNSEWDDLVQDFSTSSK